MKRYCISVIILLSSLFASCYSQILTPEEQHIPGRYEYTHSWDYSAPDSNGTIHCDEYGFLYFYSDGTCTDTAFQHHTLKMDTPIRTVLGWISQDTMTLDTYTFSFHFICPGAWKVENGKFLFCEKAEGFSMYQLDKSINEWVMDYADKIRKQSTPNSSRWITFDIERLDNEWFIWTYTYPNGRKDSWEMKRVHD